MNDSIHTECRETGGRRGLCGRSKSACACGTVSDPADEALYSELAKLPLDEALPEVNRHRAARGLHALTRLGGKLLAMRAIRIGQDALAPNQFGVRVDNFELAPEAPIDGGLRIDRM